MDPKEKRPLSEEELAAVDRAMAEFANTPRKRFSSKKSAGRQPKLRLSPLVRNILFAGVILILVASQLVFLFGSDPEEPAPTTPTTSSPTETYTDATEEPTEFPVPPETVPPTQPPVVVPEGTPLSSDEIAQLQEMFHPGSVCASVSGFSFTHPGMLNLDAIVASQIDTDYEITDEERTYLGSIYEDFLYLDVCSISRSEAEQIVAQYFGLTLDDIPDAQNAAYWEQTDRFYFIAEATGHQLTITHAVTLPGGNIWVRYTVKQTGNVCEMVLSQAGEYHILSNMVMRNVVIYPVV